MPFLSRCVLYYLLRRCREAGLDSVLILLDDALYRQLDSLRQQVAGLALNIEWMLYGDQPHVRTRLMELLQEDDPVLVCQNPALDVMPLADLLRFHASQQSDCSLRLAESKNGQSVWLDVENLVTTQPQGQAYCDTRCYLMEADIFEALLSNSVNLMRQALLPCLLEVAQYITGLPSPAYWSEWHQPQDYFKSQHQVLAEGLMLPAHHGQRRNPKATVWLGEDVLIDASVRFAGPVVIGDQVLIAEGVKIQGPAVIGSACRIQSQSEIRQSWIWPGSQIERDCQIYQSWLGEQVLVQANSRLEGLWIADHARVRLPQGLPPETILGPWSVLDLSPSAFRSHEI